jgi:hypothetical protein
MAQDYKNERQVRFKIFAINSNDEFVIKNLEDGTHFIALGRDLIRNIPLISGFSIKEAVLIASTTGLAIDSLH